jgi:hypothetical protein
MNRSRRRKRICTQQLKEKALEKLKPSEKKRTRFRPTDRLLAFLEAL